MASRCDRPTPQVRLGARSTVGKSGARERLPAGVDTAAVLRGGPMSRRLASSRTCGLAVAVAVLLRTRDLAAAARPLRGSPCRHRWPRQGRSSRPNPAPCASHAIPTPLGVASSGLECRWRAIDLSTAAAPASRAPRHPAPPTTGAASHDTACSRTSTFTTGPDDPHLTVMMRRTVLPVPRLAVAAGRLGVALVGGRVREDVPEDRVQLTPVALRGRPVVLSSLVAGQRVRTRRGRTARR
jgi:hypothetical protein